MDILETFMIGFMVFLMIIFMILLILITIYGAMHIVGEIIDWFNERF